MSLFRVFDVSGSALTAQSVRLNTVASNLANAESASSSVGTTYRARKPVFSAVMEGLGQQDPAASVRIAGIVESAAPLRREYMPGHPLADAEGFVMFPNVNPVEEMADMMSAARSYRTNVEAMDTARQLLLGTLRLGE